MKLYSLLDDQHILLNEPVGSFPEAIDRVLKTFEGSLDGESVESVRDLLLERERQHPTMIAERVCVPHARMAEIEHFLIGMIVPSRPIPHLVEGQPDVALLFVVLTPQNKNTMMLQTLAAIARLLKSRETRQALLNVRTTQRLLRLVEDSGVDIKKTLVAADIMSPVTHYATLDMSVARAVDILAEANDEGIPVLDEQGRLAGELTSREPLILGMPKYMGLIVNSAMLDNFEPFENYFRNENTMKVREICRRDLITVEPNLPIVQATHQMMTNHRRRLYVLDDDKLVGIIYRKDIISRVLHY